MVVEFANFVRGVRVVYHFTDHARVTLGQHLAQQVREECSAVHSQLTLGQD